MQVFLCFLLSLIFCMSAEPPAKKAKVDGEVGECTQSPSMSLIAWNILAAPYTKYNWQFHRAGGKMDIEKPEQTKQRYAIAGRQLIQYSADVVLLQECEPAFFSPDVNSEADNIKKLYHVVACHLHADPGTAVLVKRDGRAKLADPTQKKCVGTESPNVFTVVDVLLGGHSVRVASVHVKYWPFAKEDAIRSLKLLEEALAGQRLFVFGGDINAGMIAPNEYLPELEAETFCGKLKRGKLPEGATTGLNGDFSSGVAIDHIYSSQGMKLENLEPLTKPRTQAGPYSPEGDGPAAIIDASDHVPVLAHIEVMPEV